MNLRYYTEGIVPLWTLFRCTSNASASIHALYHFDKNTHLWVLWPVSVRLVPEHPDKPVTKDSIRAVVGSLGFLVTWELDQSCFRVTKGRHLQQKACLETKSKSKIEVKVKNESQCQSQIKVKIKVKLLKSNPKSKSKSKSTCQNWSQSQKSKLTSQSMPKSKWHWKSKQLGCHDDIFGLKINGEFFMLEGWISTGVSPIKLYLDICDISKSLEILI